MSYSRNIKSAAIGLAMATGLTCSYVEPAKADGLGDTTFVVSTNSGRLNVRQKPTTKSKVVGKLKKGSRVVVTDIHGNEWAKVGNKGWVSMDYLKAFKNSAVLEHEAQIEKENQEQAMLLSDEKAQQNKWISAGKPYTERVVECNDFVTLYEHGSSLSKPLHKGIPDGAKVRVYFTLENSDFSFVSIKDKAGNRLYGYLCWYNISANK